MGSRTLVLAAMAAVGAVGCGGAGLPPASVASLASAQGSVRAAQEVGAEEVPRAALHLKYAKDQIADAERLLEEDENDEAQVVLTMAESDAEVALELAKQAAAEEEAAQAEARLETTRRAAQEGGQ